MEKHTYQVRPGFRFGSRNQYGGGDIVELTEFEAAGFLDKLERVRINAELANHDAPTPLSPEFPARELLLEAGLDSAEMVREASDDDLLAISGIGRRTLKRIREELSGGGDRN